MVTKASFERWFGFQRMVTFKRTIITEPPTIYPGGYHWPETKYTMRLRAGQRLGILWWVTHLLTPPKRFHHLQGSSQERDGILFTCLDECRLNTTQGTQHYAEHSSHLNRHPIHNHSLIPPPTHSRDCLYHVLDALQQLRQHLPNLWPKRTREAKAREHHYLEVIFQDTHPPDWETYYHSFTIAGSEYPR